MFLLMCTEDPEFLAIPALVWLFRPFTFSVTISAGSAGCPVIVSCWSLWFSTLAAPISWVVLVTPLCPSVGSSVVTVLPSGLDEGLGHRSFWEQCRPWAEAGDPHSDYTVFLGFPATGSHFTTTVCEQPVCPGVLV